MAFNLFKKDKAPKQPKKAQEVVAQEKSTEVTPSISLGAGSDILRSFHVSEKSARGQANNQYTFVVANKATKTDVKHAVQRAFKVNVTDVAIIRLPSKHRQVGRYTGTTAGKKKAIVTLKDGQSISQAQP